MPQQDDFRRQMNVPSPILDRLAEELKRKADVSCIDEMTALQAKLEDLKGKMSAEFEVKGSRPVEVKAS